MNYTENYHLPQWEENDRVMRSDFNNAMAALEDGLSTAQSAADRAFTPEKMPYATGFYVGNGETTIVETGFRPRFIIITNQSFGGTSSSTNGILIAGPGILSSILTFLDNGFSASIKTSTTPGGYPVVNGYGARYHYIAFR